MLAWAKDHLAELKVNEQIRTDVTEGVEKQQREYLLRQQLAAIRKELGERRRGSGRRLPRPAGRDDAAGEGPGDDREGDRPAGAHQRSEPRAGLDPHLARTACSTCRGARTTPDNLDLTAAREVLDADHHGLDDVKDRIIEFLAVRKLRHERGLDDRAGRDPRDATTPTPLVRVTRRRQGSRLDATSRREGAAAPSSPSSARPASARPRSARAWPAPWVAGSCGSRSGGVRDEAEIRGHRRTYVGSQPGRIVRAITEAGTMNPVVLLDEVDKLSAGGWSGDPTAALLEVLDPAQNHTFRDHYLEVDLDLSDVVFLATANMMETIPGPLLDRMELVRLDGYTEDEKVFIARSHLLPRQLAAAGLRPDEVALTDDALRTIVADYTREAGVRSLERELGQAGPQGGDAVTVGGNGAVNGRRRRHRRAVGPITSSPATSPATSGARGSTTRPPTGSSVPGVATGLAVTGTGGDVLFIEASASEGEPSLTLTGQLGDVMKESAQIALSYVRSNAAALGVEPERLNRRFHVHVPAGAVPKDGPSAGVTMTTALVSLLTDRTVKPDRRHDRRGHAAGQGPAHRRREAEGARRPPGRADRGDPAQAQRPRPRRRPRACPGGHDLPPRRHRRRRARGRAGLIASGVATRAACTRPVMRRRKSTDATGRPSSRASAATGCDRTVTSSGAAGSVADVRSARMTTPSHLSDVWF